MTNPERFRLLNRFRFIFMLRRIAVFLEDTMHRISRYLVSLSLFLCMTFPVMGADVIGKVVGITDGDTLTLLTPEKKQVKVRLAEIDTPESKQPYGTRSKQALSDLAFNQQARVDVQTTDRYGRSVGRVYVGERDVNAAMVEQGAAWVYRQYSHDPALLDLEAQAQAAKRGLWALPESQRVPPWEWRHGDKKGARDPVVSTSAPAPAAATATDCGSKRTCGQMANCAEARHYLNDCGLRRLDRDGDGIPCESLCGH